LDMWLYPGTVNAIWILDRDLRPLAYKALPGMIIAQTPAQNDAASVQTVIAQGQMISYWDGDLLKVVAPVADNSNQISGAVLVYLPTDRLQKIMNDARQQGLVMVAVVVVI